MRLTINSIKKGVVIDHIKAGHGTEIFNYLGLDKANFTVALIINAQSNKLGKKDIIKIEDEIDIDFAILGLIDRNVTVNIIYDFFICFYIYIVFQLVNKDKGIYSCQYCDDLYTIPNM